MDAVRPFPKVRDDLVRMRLVERGEAFYMYKVPETGDYYRIDELQHEILALLDGTRAPEEVVRDFNDRHHAMSIDPEFLDGFVDNLRATQIFEKTREEQRLLFLQKLRDQRRHRAARPRFTGNIFEFTLSAWNPDRFFERAVPHLRFFWTRRFVVLSAALILAMLGVWIAEWPRLRDGTLALFTFQGKTGADIAQFFLILLVIGFFHESAHGLTCKYFGGEVRRMGFMFVYFTPCFFVDVSDAYLFDRHYKRQWTIFAGGYIELVICAPATFLWALSAPGTLVNDIAYKVLLMTGLSSVIVNYNPLIKLDGYYSLIDYLEISDLWERSSAYVSGWIKKTFFRLPVELETPTRSVRRILVVYCLFSMAYKALLTGAFLVFLKNIAVSLFGSSGYPIVVLAALLILRRPLLHLARTLRFALLDKKEVLMTPRSLAIAGAAATPLLAAALLVPLPVSIRGDFVLEPRAIAFARSSAGGIVERVLAREGQEVRPGEALAVLRNDRLSRRLPVLEGRLRLSQAAIAEAAERGDRAALAKRAAERDLAEDELRVLRETTAALTLRSPIAGVVTTPRLEDLVGTYLDAGRSFCEIASREAMLARVPVRELRLDEVRPGQPVALKLVPLPFRTFPGEVISIAPAAAGRDQEAAGPAPPEPGVAPEFTDFEAIVSLRGPTAELRPGMSGTARIRVGSRSLAQGAARGLRRWIGSRIW